MLAGDGFGFYCLPEVGDSVYLQRTEDGSWVWMGFCWDGTKVPPTEGTTTVRVFKTPSGHKMTFDENGDIELEHSNGVKLTITSEGNLQLGSSGLEAILKGETFQSTFNDLVDIFNSHTHFVAGAMGGGAGLTSNTTLTSGSSSDEADLSQKVLAE
jgi:hypothetical protein